MQNEQIPLDDAARADEHKDGGTREVAVDVAYQRLVMVNVIYCGLPEAGDRGWVLIDAGVMGSTGAIIAAAESRFGEHARPAAIVLTHGHFDHIGAVEELAERWDVSVYAHALELPYLSGEASYPPPDPTVGGGVMSALSRFYPRGPIDLGPRLKSLPSDGRCPQMPGWRWIHSPGHTPGQVSLWRDSDRTLIAADTFITTRQESAYAVMTHAPEMHGPPMYFTPNWEQARASVQRLAALEPELVITGHGPAMQGAQMRSALHALAQDFDRVAVPEHGRYVGNPASTASGTAYQPHD